MTMNSHSRRVTSLARQAIIDAVKWEMVQQDELWGTGRKLPIDRWLVLLAEEIGEVAQNVNEDQPLDDTCDELVQVAAVAIQAASDIQSRLIEHEQREQERGEHHGTEPKDGKG